MSTTSWASPFTEEIYAAYCKVAPEERPKARFILPTKVAVALVDSLRAIDRPLGELRILGLPVTVSDTADSITCVVDP